MKKLIKIYAIFIVLISLTLLAISSYSVINADDFAFYKGVAVMIYSTDNPDREIDFDNNDWKKHWIIKNSIGSVIGLLGIICGIGIFMFKKWPRNLWLIMILIITILYAALFFGGIYRYEFERVMDMEILISVLLALTPCLVLCNRSAKMIFFNKGAH